MLIISHRGNGNVYPENTIEACDEAIQQGAGALEVDIRLTADRQIVVFHDFRLERMLGYNKVMNEVTLKEIKDQSFINFPLGTTVRVPTLFEFMEHFKNRVPVNLDVKTPFSVDPRYPRDIAQAISRFKGYDQFWVSAFNPLLLKAVKVFDPKVKAGYLFERYPLVHRFIDRLFWLDAWHPHYAVADDHLVMKAQKQGKEIYLWTVNDPVNIKCRSSAGYVNGVITDNPAVPLQSLAENSGEISLPVFSS